VIRAGDDSIGNARIRTRGCPVTIAPVTTAFSSSWTSCHWQCPLGRKPGPVLGRLVHVLLFEFRILPHDVSRGVAIAKELQHELDRYPKTSDRRSAFANSWINANAIQHGDHPCTDRPSLLNPSKH